ncbi:MAG: serine O-acetyltransferase [Candidatus Omnitrophica bacterium]|nr:serine O-acetyltransferase [Candidatus Omnitrophota bacterium]
MTKKKILNPFREFSVNLKGDLQRYFATGFRKAQKKINKPKIIFETFLFKAGFHAVFLYRFSYLFYRLGLSWIAWLIQRFSVMVTGAEIEYNAEIAKGMLIAHPVGIVIGRGTKIGERFTCYQNVTFGARHLDPKRIFDFPAVGKEVTVFAGAVVVGGCKLGDGAVVGANAVVLSDVPAKHIAVGIPAKNKPLKGEVAY